MSGGGGGGVGVGGKNETDLVFCTDLTVENRRISTVLLNHLLIFIDLVLMLRNFIPNIIN